MHANMQRKAARKKKNTPTNTRARNTTNTTDANTSFTYGNNTYNKPAASMNALTQDMHSPQFQNAENTTPNADTHSKNKQYLIDTCMSIINNLNQHTMSNAIVIVNNMQIPHACAHNQNTALDNENLGTHNIKFQ